MSKRVFRIVAVLIAILCIQLTQINAAAEEFGDDMGYGTAQSMSLPEFLYVAGFEFEAYHAMMRNLAYSEVYPHFLNENARRYINFQRKHPDIPFGAIIAYVNVNADLGFYEFIETVNDPYFVGSLVNKNFALPSGWEPSDLMSIGSGHSLREEAAVHFFKMREAINDAGLRLHVASTFRSYQAQASIHSRGVSRSGLESADRQFARAGHSEHQMGLALDILHRSGFSRLQAANFQYTSEFKWLQENAHYFGFILRYPYEYTHIHGYIFEPWHWRFVGVDVAEAMFNEGIVLYEEFYGRYLAAGVLNRMLGELQSYSELAGQEVYNYEAYITVTPGAYGAEDEALTAGGLSQELFYGGDLREPISSAEILELSIDVPESPPPIFAVVFFAIFMLCAVILVFVVLRKNGKLRKG